MSNLYVPLHVHSSRSFLDGYSSVAANVERAADLGMSAINLSDPQWRPVVGYEGLYEVSDTGLVWSVGRKDATNHPWPAAPVRAYLDKGEYVNVYLSYRGKGKRWRVHRLVLEAFVGPCPEGLEACHGDGDATNNTLSNLRWDTKSKNALEKVQHGTHNCARKTHCLRGHLLSGPNMARYGNTRACRSCTHARGWVRRHGLSPSLIQELSDSYFARKFG